jgi:predicted P-loop ATPase
MVDHYRQSYGRRSQDFPRSCVFTASTNKCNWAGDETGGRRWWPVQCDGMADIEGVRRDRDQLWAEAYHVFAADEKWWFDDSDDPGILEELREEQKARFDLDPWDEKIMSWIRDQEKEYYARQELMPDQDVRRSEPYYVASEKILNDCLCKLSKDCTQADKNRVARILIFHDFARCQRRLYDSEGVAIHEINAKGETINGRDGKPKQIREWVYRRVSL